MVVAVAEAAPHTVRSQPLCWELLGRGDGGGVRVGSRFEGQQLPPGSGLAPRAEWQGRRRPLPLLRWEPQEGDGGGGTGVGS